MTEQFSKMERNAFHVPHLSDKIPEAVFHGRVEGRDATLEALRVAWNAPTDSAQGSGLAAARARSKFPLAKIPLARSLITLLDVACDFLSNVTLGDLCSDL